MAAAAEAGLSDRRMACIAERRSDVTIDALDGEEHRSAVDVDKRAATTTSTATCRIFLPRVAGIVQNIFYYCIPVYSIVRS